MESGEISGRAKRVRLYLEEGLLAGHRPLATVLLELLCREGAAGATLYRGIEGFGASGVIHTARLADAGQRLPLVIEWVDTAERVARLLPRVQALLPQGLVTVDDTEVAFSRPRPVRDVARSLTAADVMSRTVVSARPETPVHEVVASLVGQRYRAIPVTREGSPVGIVTNSDLLARAGLTIRVELLASLDQTELGAELERLSQGGKTAGDVMTSELVTVSPAQPLPEVAALMARRRLKRLPVVGDDGQMVGIVSRLDVLRSAARAPAGPVEAPLAVGLALDAPVTRSMRADVPAVAGDTPLPEVLAAVMGSRHGRCIVVDEQRRVLGKITDAELLERVTPALRPSALRSLVHRLPFAHPSPEAALVERHATARSASELMIEVALVREDTPLHQAITTLLRAGHKVLAVVDADQRLVGCLDRADLLQGLVAPDGAGV